MACKKDKIENTDHNDNIEVPTPQKKYLFGINIDSLDINEYNIENGDNLSSILAGMNIPRIPNYTIIDSLTKHLDVKKIQVGKQYIALSNRADSIPETQYIIFEKSKTNFLIVDLTNDSIKINDFTKDITYKEEYAEGTISSNLWNTMVSNKTNPLLALELSDIYGWQIDFFDIKEGDSYQVIYDIAMIDDTIPLYINEIKTAKFNHQGKNFYALAFEQDSVQEYFDIEGNSLKKAFLKAPLNFSRISSRFTNARYHPVLKIYRAHHGVDYAAPTGTPVRTIGDGVVTTKAYQARGGGYYLKIKHNGSYVTSYMHLSKYAPGIAVGSRVKQGDVIGYVGSTGLSTGPHLDFRVYKNGQAINPLSMESPPSIPIKEENKIGFNFSMMNDILKLELKAHPTQEKEEIIEEEIVEE